VLSKKAVQSYAFCLKQARFILKKKEKGHDNLQGWGNFLTFANQKTIETQQST